MPTAHNIDDITRRLHVPELSTRSVTRDELQALDQHLRQIDGEEAWLKSTIEATEEVMERYRRQLRLCEYRDGSPALLEKLIESSEKEVKGYQKQLKKLEKAKKSQDSGGCVIL